MAEVQIRRGRVQTELDAQRPALGQALFERARRGAPRRRCERGTARVIPSGPMLEFRARSRPGPPASHRPALTLGRVPSRDAGRAPIMSEHERTSTIGSRRPPSRRRQVRRVPAHARAHAAPAAALAPPQAAASASRSASSACCSCSSASACWPIVSALFGMFMAVASDLPPLEDARAPAVGDPRHAAATDRHADRQRAPDLPVRDRDRAGDEARDHLDRGPPLLHQQRRRPARHRRAPPSQDVTVRQGASRARRRSRSSS